MPTVDLLIKTDGPAEFGNLSRPSRFAHEIDRRNSSVAIIKLV
jgi:hypothetical protein